MPNQKTANNLLLYWYESDSEELSGANAMQCWAGVCADGEGNGLPLANSTQLALGELLGIRGRADYSCSGTGDLACTGWQGEACVNDSQQNSVLRRCLSLTGVG